MKILCAVALTVFAFACGGGNAKKESSIVNEGSDVSPNCCCKTLPTTAEKEIIPNYTMTPRMECSTSHGDCVDDVQCQGQEQPQQSGNTDGVPPPPTLEPSTSTVP
jgi:hypothetical protein